MNTKALAERRIADRPDLSEASVIAIRHAAKIFHGFFSGDVSLVSRAVACGFHSSLAGSGVAEGTRAKDVRWLKSLWSHARDMELLETDPWKCVKSSRKSEPRGFRMLSDDEFARILAACPSREWQRLFALCRWAGLRRGEALSLTWDDVDVEGRWISVMGHKTGRKRDVPMSPRLVPLLDGVGGVCPGDNGSLNRTAGGIVKRAGVESYGTIFHGLRKMAASSWIEHGIPIADCAKFLGHSSIVCFEFYHQPLSAAKITEQAT